MHFIFQVNEPTIDDEEDFELPEDYQPFLQDSPLYTDNTADGKYQLLLLEAINRPHHMSSEIAHAHPCTHHVTQRNSPHIQFLLRRTHLLFFCDIFRTRVLVSHLIK